jgi:hypothetical protein
MSRIESLTLEQESRMAEYVARWTEIGLCTDPADRPRAEAAIRGMYRQGGREPPSRIMWCGSPLSMAMASGIISEASIRRWWDTFPEAVLDRQPPRLALGAWGGQVRARDDAFDSVEKSVLGSVEKSVFYSVTVAIWQDVHHTVRDCVMDSIWTGVETILGNRCIWTNVYGSHDAHWLGFYRYFHDVLGLTGQTAMLSSLWELAQSAGWVLPYENICWVSERHNILSRDDSGRLHSLTGPAWAYPDGWSFYAVHGVRVPEYVIERPEEITVGQSAARRTPRSAAS